MAVRYRFPCGFFTESPRGAQADNDPLGVDEVLMGFGKMGIDLFEKRFFGWAPKIGVMTEGAIVFLAYLDDLVAGKGWTAMEPIDGIGYAIGVIEGGGEGRETRRLIARGRGR